VFPAEMVRDRCFEALAIPPMHSVVLPQGIGCHLATAEERVKTRTELHVPPGAILVLGMGYADLRKGFDLFLQVWRATRNAKSQVCLVWAGGIDPGVQAYLGAEIAAAQASGSFRFLGPRADAGALLAAADVFLLTSREDPLPSVALEAMAAGTPVIAFEDTGGIPELLSRHGGGCSVPLGDVAAMAEAALRVARATTPAGRLALAEASQAAFRFEAYSARLLGLARPRLLPVSVVVPNCNYERYLETRLASIFAQTYPVTEVIVLDDASTDDSVAMAQRTADAWGRRIQVHRQAVRSGSVFAQWRRAAEMATSEWLWIAEADDSAEPGLLAALAAASAQARDPVFAFSDSRAIDQGGSTLWPDYKTYYGPAVLAADAVFEGAAFLRSHLAERNLILNVSAVLWRREELLAALQRCWSELCGFRVAGDWRVYAEVLAREGAQVAYVSQPLNHHRRHPASVTARVGMAVQSAEISRVHGVVARLLDPAPGLRDRQRKYRKSLARRHA
jgi:hypothetical protein